MSERPVYVIAHLPVIHDTKTYRAYERRFYIMLKRHGGELLSFDDDGHTFEGNHPPAGRLILMQFPSETSARACFDDPRYQDIAKFRRASAQTEFVTLIRS